MAELNLVYQLYQKLSSVDKEAFQRMIGEGTKLTEILSVDSIEQFLKDNRFENGEVCCVHSGCTDVKCNGTRNGRQRFYKIRRERCRPFRAAYESRKEQKLKST